MLDAGERQRLGCEAWVKRPHPEAGGSLDLQALVRTGQLLHGRGAGQAQARAREGFRATASPITSVRGLSVFIVIFRLFGLLVKSLF